MLKFFGTLVTINGLSGVTTIGQFAAIPQVNVIAAKMITLWDKNLHADLPSVRLTMNGGAVLFLVNPSAQMDYAEPALTLRDDDEFYGCDYNHVSASPVRVVSTGGDSNAIVCRDCHGLHFMGHAQAGFGFDRLPVYNG